MSEEIAMKGSEYELSGDFFIKLSHDGVMTSRSLRDVLSGLDSVIKSCTPILSEVYQERVALEGLAIGSIQSGSSWLKKLKFITEKTLPALNSMDPKIVIPICLAAVLWKGIDVFKEGGRTNNLIGNDIRIENNAPIIIGENTSPQLKEVLLRQYPGREMEIDAVLEAVDKALEKKVTLFESAKKGLVKLKSPNGQPVSAITLGNEEEWSALPPPILTQDQLNFVPDKYEEPEQKEQKAFFGGVLLNVTRMSKSKEKVSWSAQVEEDENIPLPKTVKQLIVDSPELQKEIFAHSLDRPFRADIYAVYIRDGKGNPIYKRYILKSIE